ncbi:hypothetical protein ACHAW6_008014 [Cyclotella cf. meneghiniana]
MKHSHTFGCPAYALHDVLAAGNKISKWSPRARLGVNLGPSPHHARNVHLDLNLGTGHCSPQFHCRYNDFFETTSLNIPATMTSFNWKIFAGLTRPDNVPTVDQIIQPHNCAQMIQGNVTPVSPSQHLKEVPKELSFVVTWFVIRLMIIIAIVTRQAL